MRAICDRKRAARCFAVLLCIFVLQLICIGETRAKGFWDAFFQLGYDPGIGDADQALACKRIEMLLEFTDRVFEQLDVDQELLSKVNNVRSGMTSLDVGSLYAILPYSDPRGVWHGNGVRGGRDSGRYRLRMSDPLIREWLSGPFGSGTETWGHQEYFGDLGLRAFLRASGEGTYRIVTEGQFHVADLPLVNVVRVAQGLMKVGAVQAIHGQNPTPGFSHRHDLKGADLKVLYAFARDFPNMFRFYSKYFEVDRIVSSIPEKVNGVAFFDIKARIDHHAFERDYPELGKIIKRVQGMFRLGMKILDEQNRIVAGVVLDTMDLSLQIHMATQGGEILAFSEGGVPDRTAPFNPTNPGQTRFRCIFDIHLNVMGLSLDVKSLPLKLEYFSAKGTANLKAHMQRPPDAVAARGYVMRFIPIWLFDLIIPSNIEDITRDFFRTLAEGNGGQGASFEIGNYPQRALNRNLWIRTDTDILSNGMIKFGFNLGRIVARDRKNLGEEVRVFRHKLWEAFSKDYQRMRYQKEGLKKAQASKFGEDHSIIKLFVPDFGPGSMGGIY